MRTFYCTYENILIHSREETLEASDDGVQPLPFQPDDVHFVSIADLIRAPVSKLRISLLTVKKRYPRRADGGP